MSQSDYEYQLVYFGSLNEQLALGWEPAPGMSSVVRYVGTFAQTWVWLRRAKP